jgi:hypothetical protein
MRVDLILILSKTVAILIAFFHIFSIFLYSKQADQPVEKALMGFRNPGKED